MTSDLLLYEGDIKIKQEYFVDDIGLRNLSHFLCSLEDILPAVEKPRETIYSLEYDFARLSGVSVDDFKFFDIVKTHFSMSLSDFFTTAVSDDTFSLFEETCFSSLASLSYDSVKRCYHNMLNLFTRLQ